MTLLGTLPAAALAARTGLTERRIRQLAAGMALVEAALNRYGLSRMLTSDASLREGAIHAADRAGDAWPEHLSALIGDPPDDPRDPWTMPVHAPFYPELPATYRDVRIAQLGVPRRIPARSRASCRTGFEPDADGACVALGIEVPFCTAYGPFGEAALWLHARFRGASGWYMPIIWHDGPAGIAAGREIYGAPKVLLRIETGFEGPTWRTDRAHGWRCPWSRSR